ncbi:MAG TPA: hypothetical protein VN376_03925 [Longilinea sp.]|nr:hypothetical protein [Longilinea sp.]
MMSKVDFQKIGWLAPWFFSLSGLESELRRELSPAHALFQVKALAIARRKDDDDVLFLLPEHQPPLAVVHLTWHREVKADWPFTTFYASIEDFIEQRMKPDHYTHAAGK